MLQATTDGIYIYIGGHNRSIGEIFLEFIDRISSFEAHIDETTRYLSKVIGQLGTSDEKKPLDKAVDQLEYLLCEPQWEPDVQLGTLRRSAKKDLAKITQDLQYFSRTFKKRMFVTALGAGNI